MGQSLITNILVNTKAVSAVADVAAPVTVLSEMIAFITKYDVKAEFGVLCCLTTPGLRKDIRRQIRLLYSHKITYVHYNYILSSLYYHIFTFISITNLSYFLIQVYFFEEGKNMGIIT